MRKPGIWKTGKVAQFSSHIYNTNSNLHNHHYGSPQNPIVLQSAATNTFGKFNFGRPCRILTGNCPWLPYTKHWVPICHAAGPDRAQLLLSSGRGPCWHPRLWCRREESNSRTTINPSLVGPVIFPWVEYLVLAWPIGQVVSDGSNTNGAGVWNAGIGISIFWTGYTLFAGADLQPGGHPGLSVAWEGPLPSLGWGTSCSHICVNQTLTTAVHAWVTSKLDYCNLLYVGLPREAAQKLHWVQNVVACVVLGARQFSLTTNCSSGYTECASISGPQTRCWLWPGLC